MQFVQVNLKSGKNMIGYILNTVGSQIQMLNLKDDTLTFSTFSKSALNEIKELRPLNAKETELLESYIADSKEVTEIDFQIRKLQSRIDSLRNERDKKVMGLLNEALRVREEESEVLSVTDMDSLLTETGFKNLFLMQRYGLLVLGEHEEVLFINEHRKMIPLLVKQAKKVASLLNQKDLTKEQGETSLSQFASEEKVVTLDSVYEKQTKEDKTSQQKETSKGGLKITDIQDKLNEHGFQTLRKLQENRLITIHEDGTIDFGEVGHFPIFKDMLNHPKLLIDVLNQSIPAFPNPTIIPVPFAKGIEGILKQLERQFNPYSEDK